VENRRDGAAALSFIGETALRRTYVPYYERGGVAAARPATQPVEKAAWRL